MPFAFEFLCEIISYSIDDHADDDDVDDDDADDDGNVE